MKKILTLIVILLSATAGYSQILTGNGACFGEEPQFSMSYIIQTPVCGGNTGNITVNVVTSLPNCTNCLQVNLNTGGGTTIYTQTVNINGGTGQAQFLNIDENDYVIVAQAAKVPPPTSGPTYYTCYVGVKVDAVDVMQINGSVVNDPCPVLPPYEGQINVNVTGGNPPYTYDWADVPGTSNTQNRSGLAPGSYSLTVTDSRGCTSSRTFTIDEQKPTVNLSATPSRICQNGFPPNVTVTWTATPGPGWTPHPTSPYSWDGGPFISANTQSIVVSAFGNYPKTVQFRDINGCISDPVTVTVPADIIPTGSVTPLTANVCPGQTVNLTGTVTQCSMIGATPCQFSFDNGNTYQTGGDNDSLFTVNAPQTVNVRIRNQTGCVSNPITVQLDTLGKPKITYTVNPSPICPNNSSNVTINFICNPSNCAGYQYNFNNTGLTNVPASATVSFTSPVVTATTSFPLQVVSTCTLDTSIVIQVFPDNTNINAPDTIVCANNVGPFGPVTLTATGFSSITDWTPIPGIQTTTSVTVVPSVNTTYTVSGTDLNGCPRTASQDVVSLTQPNVTTPSPVDHCINTTTNLIASGALTYDWTDASFAPLFTGSQYPASPTINTTYNVIGTDINGCKDSAQVNVVIRQRPTGSANASPSSICAGNTSDVTITANAPFVAAAYSYNDGASYIPTTPFTVGPLSTTTTFDTRIRDQYGCISDAIPVTITVAPFTAAITGATALCSTSLTGTATVTVTGGSPTYEYSIDAAAGPFTLFSTAGTSQGLTNLAAGPHTIYVRDAGSICNTSTSFTVSTPPPLVLNTTAINDVRCKGETNGSIVVSVSGGTAAYDLFLDGVQIFNDVAAGSHTYSNLAGGVFGALNYDLLVVDANSCSTTVADVPVNEPTDALVAPTTSSVNACFGASNGTLTIGSSSGGWGGYTYTRTTPPSQSVAAPTVLTGQSTGSYNFSVTDSKGCTVTFSQSVGQNTQIILNATVISPDCGNTAGSLTVNSASGGVGPYTFTNNGAPYTTGTPIAGLSEGNSVLIHVVDSSPNGCSIDSTFTIFDLPRSMPIVRVVAPTCPEGDDGYVVFDSVRVKSASSSEPFTFDLFTDASPLVQVGSANLATPLSSDTITGLAGGTYVMNISDFNCPNYPVDSFVLFTAPSTFTVVKAPYAGVNPGYAELVVPQPSPFTVSSIALASDINQNTGTVILYNLTGGTMINGNAYNLSIDNPNSSLVTALKDTLGGQKYTSFSNLAPGPHTVYIRDANGCSDTILIQVPGKFFIPNLVTPNEDKSNDVFEIVSLPDNSELRVYNRWGDRVFESSNYDNKYDFKGLSDGVYYYDLEFNTGTRFKGWVQVLR